MESHELTFNRWGRIDNWSNPKITMCDYDYTPPVTTIRLRAVSHILGIKLKSVCYQRTRRGWHVICEWSHHFSPAETVALQACLGSDLKRETLNLMRVLSNPERSTFTFKRWNILYAYKLKR